MGLHPNHVIYGLFCRQEAELQIISPLLSIILTYTCAVLNAMKNNKTLQQFCGADCASICKSTGYSLFYMVHGVKPVLSFDLTLVTFLVQNLVEPLSTVDLLATHACQLQICNDDLASIHDNVLASCFIQFTNSVGSMTTQFPHTFLTLATWFLFVTPNLKLILARRSLATLALLLFFLT